MLFIAYLCTQKLGLHHKKIGQLSLPELPDGNYFFEYQVTKKTNYFFEYQVTKKNKKTCCKSSEHCRCSPC